MGDELEENRILYVEDEDDLRDLMAEWLVHQGYEVHAFDRAEDALDAVRRGEAGADLVLTDFNLPGMSGLDLAKAMLDEGLVSTAERILITSATPPRKEAAALGIGVLLKPVNLPHLVEAIEHHLRPGMPSSGDRARTPPPLELAADAAEPRAEAVRLVLYVSRESSPSQRAERRLRRLAARVGPAVLLLEVRDVADDPERAAADRITFTPTLLRVHPPPPLRMIGDLDDEAALEEVVASDEEPPSTGTA